jgi:hypothetical protein
MNANCRGVISKFLRARGLFSGSVGYYQTTISFCFSWLIEDISKLMARGPPIGLQQSDGIKSCSGYTSI